MFSPAIGRVTVTGTGSRWNNFVPSPSTEGELYVGGSSDNGASGGEGWLRIEYGGRVFSRTVSVAAAADSVGTVEIEGATSTWNVSEDITIGELGYGNVTIQDGGRLWTFDDSTVVVGRSARPTSMSSVGVGFYPDRSWPRPPRPRW